MILVSFTVFQETYAPLILKRRAEKLRKETGDARYTTLHERLADKKSVIAILTKALTRPLRLLAFHPVIQIISLLSAFYYGILYIVLSSFSELWTKQYHYSVELSGLHYIACAAGELAAAEIGGRIMDAFHRRVLARHPDNALEPEHRIPLIFPGAVIGPLGFFLYGWTAQYCVHWIAVDIGVILVTGGLPGMPIQAYIMDAYPEHVSSAMAATQFLRSLTAFLFPLFAPSLYRNLGYGWGNTAIAGVGLIFGVTAPLILLRWGKKLRTRATTSD